MNEDQVHDHDDRPLPSDADASGRSFGDEELGLLRQVLESGTLTSTKGAFTPRLERRFCELTGAAHCRAVSSGSAAVHAAIAAVDPEPGDEIVTSPITDMGAIAPILFQAAIPVFADVDPDSGNVTAATIEERLTDRTRAVVVTHLFGNCCAMDPILALCRARGVPVIEDAAQAYGARYRGRPAGTLGTIGCFSLQQTKHVTAGEGGLVVTGDAALARRIRLFSDKGWSYGEPEPDHEFLALNYRMSELQAAVALAQLDKLPGMLEHRVAMARRLDERVAAIPGLAPPSVTDGAEPVYWRYALRVDPSAFDPSAFYGAAFDGAAFDGAADALGRALQARGVACQPRYVKKPAFECRVFRERRTFGRSGFPLAGARGADHPPVTYDRRDTPGAVAALARLVVIPFNERISERDVDRIARAIEFAAGSLTRRT